MKNLYDKINTLKKELSSLMDKAEKETHIPGHFAPKRNQCYYYPDYYFPDPDQRIGLKSWNDDIIDKNYAELGLCCRNRKEAERIVAKRKAIYKLAKTIADLNAGWVPNWKNESQKKYSFYYDYEPRVDSIRIVGEYYCQDKENMFYFKSREIGEKILEICGADIVKLAQWGI
jgi:hypothetical protein